MKKIKVLSKKANHDGINGAILSIMIYYALLVVLCVLSFFTGALLWLAESAAPILEIEKGHVTFYIGCFIIMVLPSAFLTSNFFLIFTL